MAAPDLTSATQSMPATPSAEARPSFARRVLRVDVILPALTVVTLLALWELVSRLEIVNPIVLPPPTEIASAFGGLLNEDYYWENLRVTAWEALSGFAIGASVGIVLGTLIALVTFFRRAFYPLVVAFQTTPQVAIAPLFLVWFGFGLTPRVLFSATTCFFPVAISVIVGLQTVDQNAKTLLRSLGASNWQTYRKIMVPSALPVVFGGLKLGIALALVGAVVGEFVGGDQGLGVLIQQFNFQLQIAESFAVVLTLSILGLFLYGTVDFIDRKLVFWRSHR